MSWTTVKILELNVPSSRSGFVYNTSVMQKAIDELNETQRQIVAAVELPRSGPITFSVPMEDITHMVSNVRIEDNFLVADVRKLETPKANMFGPDCSWKFFPAGTASLKDNNMVTDYTLMYLRSEPQW